ncbi:MAG: CHAD domain-containing protein [Acidobacteriia bacterium]|nr:CHAD domain-containing protein [Terriglobia bacterium]
MANSSTDGKDTAKRPAILTYADAQVQERFKRLASQFGRAAKHPHDPDTIHDMRVATRRFMQSLKVFGQFFDRQSTKKMRRRLRRLMHLSGEARNCDIALELLELAGFERGKSASQLRRRRKRAEEILAELLCRWHKRGLYGQWLRHLRVINGVSGDWNCSAPVEGNARRALPSLAREFFAAGSVAARKNTDHGQLHQFRLLAKRFRYTLELFQPLFGPEMQRGVKELRALQDKLGAMNDCVTALVLIADNPGAVSAIEKLLAERETACRTHWREHFDARQKAWWLDWLSRPLNRATDRMPLRKPPRKPMLTENRLPGAAKGQAA